MKLKCRITQQGRTRSVFIQMNYGAYIIRNGKKVYQRPDFYTKITVDPKNWLTKEGRTRNNAFINAQLERAKARIEMLFSQLSGEGVIDPKEIKTNIEADPEYREILNLDRIIKIEEEAKDIIPPFTFIEKFILTGNVAAGTKKDYNNALNHLKDFDNYRKKEITWKSINIDYYAGLIHYLKKIGQKGSTINKIRKNLITFLSYADMRDELTVCQDFKKKTAGGKSYFEKVAEIEGEAIYLNEEEIKQITRCNIDDQRLSEIRDLFLIGCWSGLRISDLSRLDAKNIKNNLLSITMQKTGKALVVPVTKELRAILDKYPVQLPKIPTDQHYNREIKKVCQLAGITVPVMSEMKEKGMRVRKFIPKFKIVSSHTARRSFATNLHRRGIPSSQLMYLTGHKTEEAFKRYIRQSAEENALDVQKALNRLSV